MTEKPKPIICRVCLSSNSKIRKKCISVFEKYKAALISDNITAIANVTIREGDDLPSMICPDCLLELDTAVNFKAKCESSDNILRTRAPVIDKDTIKEDEEFSLIIKKEEPLDDQSDYYAEVEYLNDDFQNNYLLNGEQESGKQESNLDIEFADVEVKKSRAIDLKLECHDCGGFFKSKCKIKVHWKKVHLPEALICMLCKRRFKSYKAFNRHKKEPKKTCIIASKLNIEVVGKKRTFFCKECGYKSKRIKDMQSHMVIHTGDRPFQCNLCQKRFTQQSSLQGHQETAHKQYKVEVTCQYCGKFLRGRNRAYRHLKIHQEKAVQCDICKKMLKSKKSLILHMQRHSGVKLYTCELCASSYFTLAELCNHRRTKHEKRIQSFKCDICGYKTVRNETMKKHKQKHTSTNIACTLCGAFADNAEAMSQHQKRHSKTIQCPHCDLKYARRDSLHKHVRNKHKFTFASLVNKPSESDAVATNKPADLTANQQQSKPVAASMLTSEVKVENSANLYDNLIEVDIIPISC